MALPTFRNLAARRKAREEEEGSARGDGVLDEHKSERTLTPTQQQPHVDIKRATHTRKVWIGIACLLFLISIVFLILTLIGNINTDPVIRSTWFLKLDLTNILPASAGDIIFVNSLARSLGLHDFYQVGLWNFCEGYNDEGITNCSKPQTLYWFNPVEILLNELLAGATIALPAEINNILKLIRIASHLMFGFFLTGACMNFVSIFITPVVLFSRWWSFAIAIWTFIGALLTVAAAIIATVLFTIFRNVITSQAGLNIGASTGTQMFAFMWIGAAGSLLGFVIHLCLTCCCASRRDIRTGRKRGSKKAYSSGMGEKHSRKGMTSRFGRRKSAAAEV